MLLFLFHIQAIIAQQTSQLELQRAFLSNSQQPTRHYSNVLLEREKQRNVEKQKEELANLNKLQAQHREEQHRWEKDKERQRIQVEALEAQLQQREEECSKWEEKLSGEKGELERQWENYQQDLERLRESTQSVEKERERLTQERERLEQLQEKFKVKLMQLPNSGHYEDPAQVRNQNNRLLLCYLTRVHLFISSFSLLPESPQLPLIQEHPERGWAWDPDSEVQHLARLQSHGGSSEGSTAQREHPPPGGQVRAAPPPDQHHQPGAQTPGHAAADPHQAGRSGQGEGQGLQEQRVSPEDTQCRSTLCLIT